MQQGTEDKELSTNKYPLYLQLLDARPIPTASFLLVEDSKDMNSIRTVFRSVRNLTTTQTEFHSCPQMSSRLESFSIGSLSNNPCFIVNYRQGD